MNERNGLGGGGGGEGVEEKRILCYAHMPK